MGMGENAGSLDVLSLGEGGEIIVSFAGLDIVNGDGADLIIFENPFIGWTEIAIVSASMDGESWTEWPCDLETQEGCAGVHPVLSHPDNCIDARDVELAGGDAFDLADIGMEQARFIRIQDAPVSGPGGLILMRCYRSSCSTMNRRACLGMLCSGCIAPTITEKEPDTGATQEPPSCSHDVRIDAPLMDMILHLRFHGISQKSFCVTC